MKFSIQPIQRHPDILCFTVAMVMFALAQSCTAKVEPQHWETKIIQCLHDMKDHFVVQRSTIERMGMANQCGMSGARSTRVKKGFQPPCRALQEQRSN